MKARFDGFDTFKHRATGDRIYMSRIRIGKQWRYLRKKHKRARDAIFYSKTVAVRFNRLVKENTDGC